MANGNFGGGSGTTASPYLIEDVQDLNKIRFYPSGNFKLTQSINMGVYPFNEARGWLPISNFYGSLDGDGHKLFNMYIYRPAESNIGLFSKILVNDSYNMEIKNLKIENADVTGYNNVGILAGSIQVQTSSVAQSAYLISQCDVTGNILGTGNIGGMVGYLYWTGSLTHTQNFINNSFVKAHISLKASSANYGGVIGYTAHNVTIANTISDSSIDTSVNGVATTLNPSHWGSVASSVGQTLTNTYYNKESWTYGSGANASTLDAMSYKTFGNFGSLLGTGKKHIWTFHSVKGTRLPRLSLFENNKYYIKLSDGYYVYNFTTDTFDKKFETLLTREQLMENAMSNIDDVPFQAWLKLKAQVGTFDLLTVNEQSSTSAFSEVYLDMESITEHTPTDTSKKLFKKKVSFLDDDNKLNLKNTIVNLKKGIVK